MQRKQCPLGCNGPWLYKRACGMCTCGGVRSTALNVVRKYIRKLVPHFGKERKE